MTNNLAPDINGVSIILPCLNEEASVGMVIEAARTGAAKLGLDCEIIVVDNGSSDRSAQIATEHGARVIQEPNKGYGSALRRGFASAKYEIMIMGDADLTYDFEELDVLARPIIEGKADFVIGNRMKSIEPGAMPKLHQYVGNPLLSFMLRIMFHNNSVHDAHCGMRAITRTAYNQLRCVTTGMEFASEMVIRAMRCKLSIMQKDIVYHPRIGESKLRSFKDGWRHLRFMALHSPASILLVPGFLFWFTGLLISLPLAFGPIIIGGRGFDIHCMLAGGVLNIIGIQIITMGLLAKAYAHLSGLHHDPLVARFYQWLTFEKATLISTAVIAVGLLLALRVLLKWMSVGFGPLDEPRLLFLALVLIVNGFQISAASYLFSIMALPRHIEHMPAELQKTGLFDL